ncbi:nitroimidazol reductase NimA-like FMN-containing flavoprotein (pyridoxamine 5'-phosphate oxidase superfamily) [Mycoplana sp. BE70]|uniref:pyridoxamine 5'-phosphate oxidase family protein n=1 Tax=Mycoplana sp. BE70 TaxID=2817775 RepID=UPI00285BB468|nr:pyridoxamine 5'-phosphate oxidase family protein [Mycoplana sp. BE70]MDR6757394.1 nitroimidazol reductase NimA-like FMN-containing flavoprotein (pyridoxamine 5'-phosphate oxidase superfamily) [Mycoplana sp. BE70]
MSAERQLDPSTSYPVTDRNRVKRLHERASYDRAAVHAILDAALLCHVAYVIDGQPYCTPTLFWREGDRLYWHGSSASRMLRHLKAGMPACLTVSHLDGLVLARSGFNHSANYRAAMCFGTARIIDDAEEKAAAMRAVVDRFYPDRSAGLRPITTQEAKATTIIGMEIEQASAKVRAKGVGDDEADFALPIWAGVIPVKTVLGEVEPCPRLVPGVAAPPEVDLYAPGKTLDQCLLDAQREYEEDLA